jgi:hypothetical protein
MKTLAYILVGVMCVGCSTIPQGPNVTVYKGPEQTFEQYQQHDVFCRDYAKKSVGVDPETQETQTTLTRAALLAGVGAGLGAAIGAATGSPGLGAAIGGSAGVLTGGASGSARAQRQEMTLQQRLDNSYLVCMASYGHTTIVHTNSAR